MLPIPFDPGITLYVQIAPGPEGALPATVASEATFAPAAGGTSLLVTAPTKPVRVSATEYAFVLNIPSATALPGYPVDPTQALIVPTEPTTYRRTIRIDGVEVLSDTVTLNPEDVRASVQFVTVSLNGDWFARGDLNQDGTTDLADWQLLEANWQGTWQEREVSLELLQNLLEHLNKPPARKEDGDP